MKLKFYFLLLIAGLLYSKTTKAQCVPFVDADSSQFIFTGTYFSASGNTVNTTLVQGNILYFGGHFYTLGQNTGHFMGIDTARAMIQNHATWPQINGSVYKAIPDGAGGWIVGGNFTMAGDSVRNNLAHIDASSHVTSFNPGTDNTVWSLALVGASVYVGGDFKHIGGVAKNRVAKVNLTTSAVAAWNANADSTVSELEYLNGKVYAGGFFANIGGLARNYIAKLDTTLGVASTWNANATGTNVKTITFHAGVLYAGGAFTNIGGAARNNAAALDTGTALANGWNPNVGGSVYKIVHNGATVYLAGYFGSIGAAGRNSFGEVDSAYGDTTAFNPVDSINYSSPYWIYPYYNDIVVSGNSIYLGGSFFYPIVIPFLTTGAYNYLAKIDIPTSICYPVWCYSDQEVHTLGMSGGKLYAGGDFVELGFKKRSGAAAIDMVADTMTSWDPEPGGGDVYCMAAGPSKIYLGGSFEGAGPGTYSTSLFIVSTDPVTGMPDPFTTFNTDLYPASSVNQIVYNDGNLYISGAFTGAWTYTRNGLAKVNATTGALDMLWHPAPVSFSSINALAADSSNIYIGGTFSSMGGASRNNLCAVDKVNGIATAWNPSPTSTIYALSVNSGKMYVGGFFNSIGGSTDSNLARLSLATGLADAWHPNPNNEVHVIYPYYNTAFIAGEFDHINTTSLVQGFGSVDTINNVPMSWNPAPDYNSVNTVAVSGNKMYVGGSFTNISAQSNYPSLIAYRLPEMPDTNHIAGPTANCAGVRDLYTASTGITGCTYRWYVNGVHVGSGADTFSYVPANGDVITCLSIPPAGCYMTDTAMSNYITMSVTINAVPSVTISGHDSICNGSSQTYTATPSMASPSYVWRVNGASSGTAGSYTYGPANGDMITCKIIPPPGCYTVDSAISNTINVFAGPPVVPVITIDVPANVPVGETVTVNATVSGAGSSYQVKWYVNGVYEGVTTVPVFTYTKGSGRIM